MAGTPTYISPEALRSQPVSFATDIYSCGVILYETIAGKPPFSAILAGIERDLLVLQ